MKIALPTHGALISPRFGKTKEVTFVSIAHGRIAEKKVFSAPATNCLNMAEYVEDAGATVVIAAGMGVGGRQHLERAGIRTILGAQGDVDGVLAEFLAGRLESKDGDCGHHEHAHADGEHAQGGCSHG